MIALIAVVAFLLAVVGMVSAFIAHARLGDAERRLRDLECVVREMLKDKGHGEATCFLLVPGDMHRRAPRAK